jgi:hypothetical protein
VPSCCILLRRCCRCCAFVSDLHGLL